MTKYVVTVKDNGSFKAVEVLANSVKELKEKYGKDYVTASRIERATEKDLIEQIVIMNIPYDIVGTNVEADFILSVENRFTLYSERMKVVNVIYRDSNGNLQEFITTTDTDIQKTCDQMEVTYVTTYGKRKEELCKILQASIIDELLNHGYKVNDLKIEGIELLA